MKSLIVPRRMADRPLSHGGLAGILAARRGPMLATPAYANTITGLIGQLYAGLDTVSRELVGYIPSVTRDTGVERAAVGQSVTFYVPPAQVAQDIVPQMTIPTPPDNALGTGTMAITKARAVAFGWTGEEQRALNNGIGVQSVQAGLFAQGLRTLVNEVERDLAVEASVNASRATGVAGTTPFYNSANSQYRIDETADVRKILDDNGAPPTGRSLIINTAAGANLRKVSNLTRVNEAGNSMGLRDGELQDLNGLSVKESGQGQTVVAGSAAGSTTNAAGYAIGAKVITLAAAGTGTFVTGDVVSFAGDTNLYVVAVGNANVGAGGTISLQSPGLRVAIPAAATAITRAGNHAANIAFSQNALGLAMRAPALPEGGDAAVDRTIITDSRSGMSFEVCLYAGYKMIRAEVGAAWGVKAIKPEHIAELMG